MLRRSPRNALSVILLVALVVWLFSILVLLRPPVFFGNGVIMAGAVLIAVAGLFGALSEAEQLLTKLRWPRKVDSLLGKARSSRPGSAHHSLGVGMASFVLACLQF